MTSRTRSFGLLVTLMCAPVGALPVLGGCTTSAPLSDAAAGDGSGSTDLSGRRTDLAGSVDAAGTPDAASGSLGDCTTDAECAPGKCVALTSGGFHVCTTPPVQATACTHGNLDQCCKTSQCKAGQECLSSPLIPMCSGVFMVKHNVCGANECTTAADCQNGDICVPAGALGFQVNGCLAAACHVNSDCTAHPGGVCAPVNDDCCNDAIGLYCVYPGTGCRQNSDCQTGQHCGVSGDTAQCVSGPVACPA